MLDAHVVSHTHWDREWYHQLERFRQRLVALVDELLDSPPAPGESFLLDGQAIVVEDYLAVRPERRADLGRLLADGRLEAGPWYVLGDELIPGGEAIVRNLLQGRRSVRSLGGTPPPVLYCPDSFGHPAALPMIAQGFGLPLVVLWRGYGGAASPGRDTALWSGPDGSEVLLYHLPRSGYEFGSSLPPDATAALERWNSMRRELAERATTGVVLVPNGADHHARQRMHARALAELASAGATTGDRVHASSLAAFAKSLDEAASGSKLPTVRGELRDSYGYTWTLQGTFSTRAHEKRLNARAERTLTREAEPWAALARAHVGTSRSPLVRAAWRDLLQAHPHDTLCGCSIDAVARAMELRLEAAISQAEGVRDDSLLDLLGQDAAAARERRDAWSPRLILRNAAARPRAGVALVQLEEFVADVPVGPGSAPNTAAGGGHREMDATSLLPRGVVQALRTWTEQRRIESPVHYPDNDLVRVTEALVWVDAMQGYSTRAVPLGRDSSGQHGPAARLPAPKATARATRVSNGKLALEISPDGTISLEDVASGRRVDRLIELWDQTDLGDLYTPAPRGEPLQALVRSARVTRRGPLRCEIEVRLRLPVLATQPRWRKRRSLGRPLDTTVRISLDAGARFIRLHVSGDNNRSDHRLRLSLRTGISQAGVFADAAFGAVKREGLPPRGADDKMEHALRTAPLHRYVTLSDDRSGATVFSDGLAEYEATEDGRVMVTLLRAVGELSRNELPERPGHAGWPMPTPGAQCRGAFEANFALALHDAPGATTTDFIECTSDDVLMPLTGTTLRSALAVGETTQGLELRGAGLAFSACKEADADGRIVLRCVNLLDTVQSGEWVCGFSVTRAQRARLDETPAEDMPVHDSRIQFDARPREVVTILVTPVPMR